MNTSQSKSVGCFSRGCLSIVLHSIWILLLFGGLYYAFNSWQLTSNGVEVDAVVVDSGIQSDTEGTSYSPIYEYTYEGQTYQYDSPGSSSTLTHKIGDHATLLIDPSKPDRARENSFAPLWMLPSILIPLSLCLGVFTILLGALLSRYGRVSNIQISP
jgi:hypothetical protein